MTTVDRWKVDSEWREVYRAEAKPKSDGQTAIVEECRLPAKFYRLRVLDGLNSMGEHQDGFTMTTGSGSAAGAWARLTADMIAEGMIGLAQVEP